MTAKINVPNKELFRPDEAADFLCRSRKTIYRWCQEDRIDHVRIQRRGILIPRSAIVSIIRIPITT